MRVHSQTGTALAALALAVTFLLGHMVAIVSAAASAPGLNSDPLVDLGGMAPTETASVPPCRVILAVLRRS